MKMSAALILIVVACVASLSERALAKGRRVPGGGQRAVVVDERLAALRDAPDLSAVLLQRISRGRMLAITGARRGRGGLLFYRVAVTSRTSGWMQSEAVVSPARAGDDERLLRLIRASEDFDLIERARIFLDLFPRSNLRPAVLLLFGEAAEEAAAKLSRDALRRLDEKEMKGGGAPAYTYFMNYNGLDRYRRQGIAFVFDERAKQFHYNGESWREIARRYPRSLEVAEARKHLDTLGSISQVKAP
ncbi:MAG: hypothetical protein WCB68_00330 [Pyrinomonadaceae bacterium]